MQSMNEAKTGRSWLTEAKQDISQWSASMPKNADNERIDIGHGGQQLGLVGIFFKQGQFIARVLDDPADAVDSLLGKRLFGRN